jgi:hypothetical protein
MEAQNNGSNSTTSGWSIDELRRAHPRVEEFLYLEKSAAEEIPAFTVTRYELLQVVKFWYRWILEGSFWWFLTGGTGSIQWSIEKFAEARIQGIQQLLGAEDVKKAIAEAEVEFGKDQQPEAWRIFLHGDAAERKAFRDKVESEIQSTRLRPSSL